MKRILTLAILLAFSLGSLPALATADLSKIRFGSHVTGPEVTKNDLQNRFVIVEYWGVNCPPCIRAIPGLTKLAEDYGHDKLIVLAFERQGSSADKIKKTWEDRASSNHVAVFAGGNLPNFGRGSIPDSILFDPYGRELYRGSPTGLKSALKDAMKNFRPLIEAQKKEVPDPIVTGVEAKFFKRELATINAQERKIDSTLRNMRRVVERSSRTEQVEEGNAILTAVAKWAQDQQTAAESAQSSDPAKAYSIADKAVELLGSDELGKALRDMQKAMEADEALMDTIRSTNMLRDVKALAEKIGLGSSDFDKSKHSKDLRTIARDLKRITRTWPETDAGKEATGLLSSWGL